VHGAVRAARDGSLSDRWRVRRTAFAARAAVAPRYASALFSGALQVKVRAGAVRSIFESMVDLSDNGDLMATFLELPMPRMFMYGE
jgi:hypothetical protein